MCNIILPDPVYFIVLCEISYIKHFNAKKAFRSEMITKKNNTGLKLKIALQC